MYPPEFLPLKLRAKGIALAAATDFLGTLVVRIHRMIRLERQESADPSAYICRSS